MIFAECTSIHIENEIGNIPITNQAKSMNYL